MGKKVRRLSGEDWLLSAIELLAERGIGAVTVKGLARMLHVTRGSFYHHFRNRQDMLDQMLEYWNQKWTMQIRESNKALALDPKDALLALMRAIRHEHAADYDVAFRAWAQHDQIAAKVVKQVDQIRLDHIHGLFKQMGFKGMDAENRTRLFLYYEMAEPSIFARSSKAREEKLLVERHRYLTTNINN